MAEWDPAETLRLEIGTHSVDSNFFWSLGTFFGGAKGCRRKIELANFLESWVRSQTIFNFCFLIGKAHKLDPTTQQGSLNSVLPKHIIPCTFNSVESKRGY